MANDDDLDEMRAPVGELERTLLRLDGVSARFGRSLTSALKAAVVEVRALDDVLKGLALSISGEVMEAALAPLSKLIGGLAGSLTGAIGSGLGSLFGGVVPFAKGGVVSAPTFFPMGDGGIGLAGEAGSEAILPLARGSDGRLGVRGEGGGGPVTVTFNVTAGDAASFRRSEAQITAMLARAVGRGRRGL